MSSERAHLVDEIFNIEKMIQMLGAEVQLALADGYSGLWSTGDVYWELGGKHNFDKIFEYEQRLHEYMSGREHFSCVCQYHQNTLPPGSVNIALQLHPAVYISNTLAHENTFYKLN